MISSPLENTENHFNSHDLELYIYKKILVEKRRDDSPFPLIGLSFYNNSVKDISRVVWFLHSQVIVCINYNTHPDDLLVISEDATIMNWPFIENLDVNPIEISQYYGFDIELLEEDKLKELVDSEIDEFVSNKANKKNIGKFQYDPSVHFYNIPLYLRQTALNSYSYKKQREILLRYIALLYNEFENDLLVIKFDDNSLKNISILRTILALESERVFDIVELNNSKKKWTDKDEIYAKVLLLDTEIENLKRNKVSERLVEYKDSHKIDYVPVQDENIKYSVVFSDHSRVIKINGIEIAKPDFDGLNHKFFSYVYSRPGKVIKISDFEDQEKVSFSNSRRPIQVLADLGFKAKLKDIFFPVCTKTEVKFVNPITDKYFIDHELPDLTEADLKVRGKKK